MEHTFVSLKKIEDQYLLPSYSKFPISIERGKGMFVWDEQERKYLDLYGGHAVSLLGHSHPRLLKALQTQAEKLFFYSNVSYNSTRGKAARDLVCFTQGDYQVFFSNSGSEANENALKASLRVTGRKKIISFEKSFHGRTPGSLSITGIQKYRKGLLADSEVCLIPPNQISLLRSALTPDVACVVVESIQSLSGVFLFSKEFLQETAKLCEANGTLFVMDEIQTGLGRCGVPMYFHELQIEPDVVTLAKGIAGGFPMGATLVKKRWAERIQIGDLGSTFGGGPLACALLSETLHILEEEKLIQNAKERGRQIQEELSQISTLTVRGKGLLLGIQNSQPSQGVVEKLRSRGILVGSSLDPETFRILSPLIVTQEQVSLFVETLKEIL